MVYTCKPKKVSIYVNTGRKTTSQIKAETGCTALINGGLYDMSTFKPVYHLKVDGKVLASEPNLYWGVGWNNGSTDLQMVQSYAHLDNYICAVCMVRDGKAEKMYYPAAMGGIRERTAFGVYEDGRVWLYADKTPKSPEQLQKTALQAGVKYAIMLDGGDSTQGANPSNLINSGRVVHNYICVWEEDQIKKDDDKMKIYISPSSQPANMYAAGNTNEQVQCNRIAEAARVALERCGFKVKKAPEGQLYAKNVAESDAWGADLHIPIHTNAGGGYGPVVFVYSIAAKRTKYAVPVYDELCKVVPRANSYGVRANKNLYEVSTPKATTVYCECEFHDDPKLAQWIIDNVEALGEAICKGICKGAGVEYVEQEKPAEVEKTLEERVAALEAWARANGMK